MSNETPTTTRTLKGRSSAETRSAVLDLIRSAGTISRVDLARRSALTETTISKVVKELIASGAVVEAGFAQSTGGKPATLLRLNDGGVYALGMTLDDARSVIVLCGADGAEIARTVVAGTHQEDPALVLKRLSRAVLSLLKREGVEVDAVLGLGVAAAGRRGWHVGAARDANNSDIWERFPIEEELGRLTGIAVTRENDANCAALGEYWSNGASSQDFASVYLSYGIGCGIVIGGGLYRGSSRNAGEIGHTIVDPDGLPCWCGSRGCAETVASPRGIVRRILLDPDLRREFAVQDDVGRDERAVQAEFSRVYREVVDRVLARDATGERLLHDALQYFTMAVSNLVNTLDLDLVVLAGTGFADIGDRFLAATEERLRTAAFMQGVHPVAVKLVPSGVGTTALGAASVVLHHHLTPHRAAFA